SRSSTTCRGERMRWPPATKEGGEFDVAEVQPADRAPDRLGLLPYPGLATLVAFHCVGFVLGPQKVGRGANDAADRWVVRLDEGGQDVGDRGAATPLVRGKDADVVLQLGHDIPAGLCDQRNHAARRL